MHLPVGIYTLLMLTAYVQVAQFFACGNELVDTNFSPGEIFVVISDFATFDVCDGLTGNLEWVRWTLFALITVPWILLLAAYLFQLFNNQITGTIVAALGIGVALIAIF